ncbi:NUDIX hydrolase [Jiella pacifica]|uniref:NUDIX domain-containing protein n=1 Tax=Jiella pacifica TaxID=2696469 RepID=A0A6N9SW48_9HYPH|nr:NUDIX domain-containing protein [Jiella pacifica]NDW03273.1 NUDIX domain-containing protein [Jiella pacifica]
MSPPASRPAQEWTPSTRIRPIAIGLCVDVGHVLLMEVRRGDGKLIGHRPPGGGIEFMESAEAAVIREFTEELGWRIVQPRLLETCENLFEHEGRPGHEIVFIFAVERPQGTSPPSEAGRFDIVDGGIDVAIRWMPVEEALAGTLFPPALAKLLGARTTGADQASAPIPTRRSEPPARIS